MNQALDLIFNEYLIAYNVEVDSWDPDIDWSGQSLGSSYVASFRESLDRIGCESLNSPNYLFEPEKNDNTVAEPINRPLKKRTRDI